MRKELEKNIDLDYKRGVQGFFKEDIKVYGARTPMVRKIARKYFPKESKDKVFALAEKLLKTDYQEDSIIAFQWMVRFKGKYEKKDFFFFEKCLKKYVNNWAKCDDFCCHVFGYFLLQYPCFLKRLQKWTKSKNRWERRASAVCLIPLVKQEKKYLKDVFLIADLLLQDKDDLVQKGSGWLLKEASNFYQKEVFDFVMKRKGVMPRTALRYAIEKMPSNLKKKAMQV